MIKEYNTDNPLPFGDEYWVKKSDYDALQAKLEKMANALLEIGDKFEGLPPGDIANNALAECAG